MSDQVLKFKLGEEYKVRIEKYDKLGESLFRDVYENAYRAIDTIVSSNNKKTNNDYEKYNNIIAFVGERGTGKTSCMISFAESLRNVNEIKDIKLDEYSNLNKNEFILTDVIDPSLLAENSNILEIVLANMFKKFKIEVGKDGKCQEQKRTVLTAFTEVYDNLKTIYSTKEDLFKNDGIDALLKLSASSDLKNNMTNLVENYLKFIKKNNQNTTLVIQVDDIDLNTKHAYEMVEQIRKYLIIPNVVILMAVKLSQLSDIIKLKYIEEYEEALKQEIIDIDEIIGRTEKYLEKLIPQDRRNYLPDFKKIDKNLKVIIVDSNNNPKHQEESLELLIRNLIYKKTGFIFLNSDYRSSYIVPSNLREIANIISLLCHLEDESFLKYEIKMSNENSNEKKILENQLIKNHSVFKNYFFENWCKNNLEVNQFQAIKELLSRNPKEKNKYIINKLEDLYSLLKKDKEYNENSNEKEEERSSEYKKIIYLDNNPLSVSLGDVLFTLSRIDRYKIDEKDKRFIFAIKTTYSMMLYESYYNNINEYKKLIGGFVYNYKQGELLAREGSIKTRHRQFINYSYIKELMNSTDDDEKLSLKYKLVYLLHYFIVVNKNSFNENYRKNNEIFYEKEITINSNLKAVTFDLTLFLFTSLNPKETLERYIISDSEIIKKLGENQEKNLYNFFKSVFKDEEYVLYKDLKLESEDPFYIGNIEMLERLLSKNYRDKNSSTDFFDHFKKFIEKFSESLELDNLKKIKINNSIVVALNDIFKNYPHDDIKEIFGKIFNPVEEKRQEVKEYFKNKNLFRSKLGRSISKNLKEILHEKVKEDEIIKYIDELGLKEDLTYEKEVVKEFLEGSIKIEDDKWII